jgi:hypothetical protein
MTSIQFMKAIFTSTVEVNSVFSVQVSARGKEKLDKFHLTAENNCWKRVDTAL